ncbi:MAG: DNA-processing protein DprA [Pseudomonadota bacterium]|nr:DNA-processing protein DprA [Pseudomonadota bacterium]
MRLPRVGPAAYARFVARFGTPEAVFAAGEEGWRAAGLGPVWVERLRAPPWQQVDQDLRWLEAPAHHLLLQGQPDYPALLAEIPDPPPLLFVTGDPAALHTPSIAIVGSRRPTPEGQRTACDFARALARSGLTIASGLAIGIDAAAHEGALAAQGSTLAVCGAGPDRIYPARHAGLARRIVAEGALVTEFPPGTPPLPANFPRRNRILSGLAHGVLVVEAAERSGSLITARLAAEQGREVFAVPGSIRNPLARGCHRLLRQGAVLVETASEVLAELPALGRQLEPASPAPAHVVPAADPTLSAPARHTLQAMGFEPVSVDVLVARTALTVDALSSILLELELQGHVLAIPGGLYSRVVQGSE